MMSRCVRQRLYIVVGLVKSPNESFQDLLVVWLLKDVDLDIGEEEVVLFETVIDAGLVLANASEVVLIQIEEVLVQAVILEFVLVVLMVDQPPL